MQRQNFAKDSRKRRLIFQIVRIAAAVLVVGILALVEYLCPLRTLLPAKNVSARQEGEMRIHFLDAGGGDCTVVEFPEGDLLVVDGGDGAIGSDVFRYVKGLDPQSVSIVATNARNDHTGGLVQILETFPVKEVYLPAIGADTGSYRRFRAAAEHSGAELKRLSRYDVVSRPSGAYAVCLSPDSSGESNGIDASAMLYLQYEGVRVLLNSDGTATREERLLREYLLDRTLFDSGEFKVRLDKIDVLKVAAHGQNTASADGWIALLDPQTAIVSCKRGSTQFSGKTAQKLARAALYRTDEGGNIVVAIQNGAYRVTTE